jgi:predicted metal-dependent hydrolase
MAPVYPKYSKYAQRKAKLVTALPVVVVENPNMKTATCKAKILKYRVPKEYKIVFAGKFYDANKSKTEMIEDIISHELAHIKYPNTHGCGFRKLAGKLGASKRYQLPR